MPRPHEIRTPTVEEYVVALRAIDSRGGISAKQRVMLERHHAAPAHSLSATRLAQEVGYKNYRAANLQYGRLGYKLAAEIAIPLPRGYVGVGILVDFVEPGYAANQHWLWVLRPNVARALEELGWVGKTTDLLYPPRS